MYVVPLLQWVYSPMLIVWWLVLSVAVMLGSVIYCSILIWRILVLVLAIVAFICGVTGAVGASTYLIRRRDTDTMHSAKVGISNYKQNMPAVDAGILGSLQTWTGCHEPNCLALSSRGACIIEQKRVLIRGSCCCLRSWRWCA